MGTYTKNFTKNDNIYISKKNYMSPLDYVYTKEWWRSNGHFKSELFKAILNVKLGNIEAPIKILNNAEIREKAKLRTINPV